MLQTFSQALKGWEDFEVRLTACKDKMAQSCGASAGTLSGGALSLSHEKENLAVCSTNPWQFWNEIVGLGQKEQKSPFRLSLE